MVIPFEPGKWRLVNGPTCAAASDRAISAILLQTRCTPIVRNILLVYAALLPIVNPLGMAPIFAGMLEGYDVSVRRTVAMRVAVNGFVLLMASLFIGSYVLDFFGVSLGAVQMGGGLIVMISGWRILNQQSNLSERQVPRAEQRDDSVAGLLPVDHAAYGGPGFDRRRAHAGQQCP